MGYGPPGGYNAGMPSPGYGNACRGGSVWAEVAVGARWPKYSVFFFFFWRGSGISTSIYVTSLYIDAALIGEPGHAGWRMWGDVTMQKKKKKKKT